MATITITIPETDLKIIKDFCRKEDYSLSAILRKGAKKLIENEN